MRTGCPNDANSNSNRNRDEQMIEEQEQRNKQMIRPDEGRYDDGFAPNEDEFVGNLMTKYVRVSERRAVHDQGRT